MIMSVQRNGKPAALKDDPAGANASPRAYLPVTASTVRSVTFKWTRASPIYKLDGAKATHRGGSVHPYAPVIGNLELRPNTGKYYFEYRVNTDNCRIGFCSDTVYGAGEVLGGEFGAAADLTSPSVASVPSYLQQIGAVPRPGRERVAHFEVQTSKSYVSQNFHKHLWRLFVAGSGALFSFVVDTDEGVVQLFVDKVYQGVVFDGSAGLKGSTLYPCVGISGCDIHNRSIGEGFQSVVVSPAHPFDCIY
ncbi:hypothetical protein STCU_00575 [Strigomonas culicis]|uniref:Uncharacterized protein n=1 Tax=Strigomonas culicis TaxID=28005 RepID=S9VT07_9TRYP|nr:hypothetical protein STCU_04170 [Strigomonas culicis]EPY36450.1 hypothetical protein STCU_00575 [Strigomonas culicis]|eukprot:EPY30231.1 hypothetical protein STCU_04170 [Strigomonas culicis]